MGCVELWVNYKHINGLPSDDGIRVRPIQRCVHDMKLPGRSAKAGKLLGLDAGCNVHGWWEISGAEVQ
jgi:hypothetical protein